MNICFSYLTTIDWTYMGILVDSPPWNVILGPLRLSPPQIFICGNLRVSRPQIDIYRNFSCITTVDLHLWAFQFSVQSQLFSVTSRAILFSIQRLESVFSFRAITPNILDHQHCMPYPHSFKFHHTSHFIAYVFLTFSSYYFRVFPSSICIQYSPLSSQHVFQSYFWIPYVLCPRMVHIWVFPLYAFFLFSLVFELLLDFDIDFRVAFEDFSKRVQIHSVTLEAPQMWTCIFHVRPHLIDETHFYLVKN